MSGLVATKLSKSVVGVESLIFHSLLMYTLLISLLSNLQASFYWGSGNSFSSDSVMCGIIPISASSSVVSLDPSST